jgi:hypothetical protein
MKLSSTLKPLEGLKQHFTVLENLHVFNNTSGPHWPLFSNYLSGAQFRETLMPEGGESIDQVIARHTGKETAVPSLVLGVEPAESGLRGGVPSVYYGTVSWSSKNTPIAPEIFPRALFDRLFDTSGLLRDKSVLDVAQAQSKDMRRGLGGMDQQKLDEFMHSLRDLELRIERVTKEARLEGQKSSLGFSPSQQLKIGLKPKLRFLLLCSSLAARETGRAEQMRKLGFIVNALAEPILDSIWQNTSKVMLAIGKPENEDTTR